VTDALRAAREGKVIGRTLFLMVGLLAAHFSSVPVAGESASVRVTADTDSVWFWFASCGGPPASNRTLDLGWSCWNRLSQLLWSGLSPQPSCVRNVSITHPRQVLCNVA
jgi:hypothetical protein